MGHRLLGRATPPNNDGHTERERRMRGIEIFKGTGSPAAKRH
jgi:hypothetical protein